MDGAMGTMLQSRGLPVGVPSALWTLERPEEVLKVHQKYVDAGAEVIFTNTFMGGFIREMNQQAVRLAREAGGEKVYVAGDVGPLGKKMDNASDVYHEQIEALVSAGVDLIALETMTNRKEIEIAVQAAKSHTNDKTPLLVSMTVTEKGLLPSGENPIDLVPFLEKNGVAIIGLNCSSGPESIYPVFRKLRKKTKKFISIKPNAGLPSFPSPLRGEGQGEGDTRRKNTLPPTPSPQGRGGDLSYPVDDEPFAQWAKRFIDEGANLIGGCCGTTPETIRKMAKVLSRNFRPVDRS